jgi:hypothetical protein
MLLIKIIKIIKKNSDFEKIIFIQINEIKKVLKNI